MFLGEVSSGNSTRLNVLINEIKH